MVAGPPPEPEQQQHVAGALTSSHSCSREARHGLPPSLTSYGSISYPFSLIFGYVVR
ncbi:hypothetical protein C2S52_020322 [Perilla frutescens var. hirtella]|nr:hypothetical protein C2S52_020322 [Perilla frutescens var. hirtella]KAH6805540.1 hypothetical protein C2S51_030371 [Perilla frutescens var. frutescens]